MAETNFQKKDQMELLRYLFGEMGDGERDLFDRKLLDNDVLFYDAAELENELIDRYTAGKLSGDELSRFEHALEHFPARRSKISNAIALHEFIKEEKGGSLAKTTTDPAAAGLWHRIAEIFTIRSPVYGAVMATISIAAVATSIFFYLESSRTKDQLDQIQSQRTGFETNTSQRENELRSQIAETRKSVDELNARIGDKEQESEELVKSLEIEQQRIQQLENELEKTGGTNRKVPTPKPSSPTIASLVLDTPENGGGVRTTSVGENTKKLAVNIALPDDLSKDEKLSVELNRRPFIQNISPRIGSDGKRRVGIMIQKEGLNIGANKLIVLNATGKKIAEFEFSLDQP